MYARGVGLISGFHRPQVTPGTEKSLPTTIWDVGVPVVSPQNPFGTPNIVEGLRMETSVEITPRVEALVWKRLGIRSARQIAQEVGLKPEQVLAIKQKLLDDVDVLTVQQARQKLITDLRDIAQRTQDDYDAAPMEFKSGLMNSAVSAMKAVLVELARADKGEQAQVERLNMLRVNELLRLIDATVDKTLDDIARINSLDKAELLAIFQSHLLPAAKEMESEAGVS